MKTSHFLALALITSNLTAQASDSTRDKLFPNQSERAASQVNSDTVGTRVKSCFTPNNATNFAGYARVAVVDLSGKPTARLERSIYDKKSIDNCLVTQVASFLNTQSKPNTWAYAHILTTCDLTQSGQGAKYESKNCKLDVFLNNFAEDKDFKNLVDGKGSAYIKMKVGEDETIDANQRAVLILPYLVGIPTVN